MGLSSYQCVWCLRGGIALPRVLHEFIKFINIIKFINFAGVPIACVNLVVRSIRPRRVARVWIALFTLLPQSVNSTVANVHWCE
jgi:hypothetical protein